MQKLYGFLDGEGRHPLPNLGYDPGTDDRIVGAVHSKLNMFTGETGERDSMKIWGWDAQALRDGDRYRIEQLFRSFLYQEDRIVKALDRLDEQLATLRRSSPEAADQIDAFVESLRTAAKEREEAKQREAEKQREEAVRGLGLPDFGEFGGIGFGPGIGGGIWGGIANGSIIDLYDPEVARSIGYVASLAQGGMGFGGEMWRLTDRGYGPDRIPDAELRDLVDTVLAVEAEYQLQCLLTDREFQRIISTRGQEFEYLRTVAATAAAEQGSGFWGLLGDVLGVVSAVAGVLALIPALTPLAGPIAVVAAVASLGAHTVDAAIKGDWDVGTFAGLVADGLAALPGIGAVSKGLKAGTVAMRTVGKAGVAARTGGQAFLAAAGGVAASEATTAFNYLGTKGAQLVNATASRGKVAGKVLQGAVSLSTQVPLAVGWAGADVDTSASTGASLVANYGQSIGSWGPVGTAAKKTSTISLALLGAVIGRR